MATYAFTFGLLIPSAFAAGMEHAGEMAGIGLARIPLVGPRRTARARARAVGLN